MRSRRLRSHCRLRGTCVFVFGGQVVGACYHHTGFGDSSHTGGRSHRRWSVRVYHPSSRRKLAVDRPRPRAGRTRPGHRRQRPRRRLPVRAPPSLRSPGRAQQQDSLGDEKVAERQRPRDHCTATRRIDADGDCATTTGLEAGRDLPLDRRRPVTGVLALHAHMGRQHRPRRPSIRAPVVSSRGCG